GFVLVGCGPTNELGREPISGTVNFDGKPLDRGSISFEPAGEGGTRSGATIENGTFSIPEQRGLPPGRYLVRINSADGEGPAEEMPGESNRLQRERIPPAWNTNSKEEIEVTDGGENTFTFDVKTGG